MAPRQNLERSQVRTHLRTAWNPARKCFTAAPGMCSASRCPGCHSSSRIPQATTADQVDMPPRQKLERSHFRTHFRTAWNPARKCLTAAPGMCSASRCPGCRSSSRIPQGIQGMHADDNKRCSEYKRCSTWLDGVEICLHCSLAHDRCFCNSQQRCSCQATPAHTPIQGIPADDNKRCNGYDRCSTWLHGVETCLHCSLAHDLCFCVS
jgi:hypothetical protein